MSVDGAKPTKVPVRDASVSLALDLDPVVREWRVCATRSGALHTLARAAYESIEAQLLDDAAPVAIAYAHAVPVTVVVYIWNRLRERLAIPAKLV